METIALRFQAIVSRLEAIASRFCFGHFIANGVCSGRYLSESAQVSRAVGKTVYHTTARRSRCSHFKLGATDSDGGEKSSLVCSVRNCARFAVDTSQAYEFLEPSPPLVPRTTLLADQINLCNVTPSCTAKELQLAVFINKATGTVCSGFCSIPVPFGGGHKVACSPRDCEDGQLLRRTTPKA